MKQPVSLTVLITGTSSGFGKLIAISLAGSGHRVIAGMRDISAKNAAAAAFLAEIPGILPLELDVTLNRSVRAAVKKAQENYGDIDVLICNAGISGIGLFEATSVSRMKKIFEVNLWGAVRCMQAVLPAMRKNRSGLIINISSIAELFPIPFLAPYTASKSALGGISESLRDELSPYGIEVVTVLPGPHPTGIGTKENQANDRPQVADAYGPEASARITQVGQAFDACIADHHVSNDEVADAIHNIISLHAGSRRAQVLINRVAHGIEQRLADIKAEIRPEWLKRMGFTPK